MDAMTRLQADHHPSQRTEGWTDPSHYILHRSQEFDYLSLANELRDHDVLDWGCNNGYGTAILAERNRVLGIDVSPRLVAEARARFPSTRFEECDGTNVPLADGSVDAVALFQVIEHVTDPDSLLRECRRILRPNGRVVITTPNEQLRLMGGAPWNPFHALEYSAEGLRNLALRHFRTVRVSGLRGIAPIELIERNRYQRRRDERDLIFALETHLRDLASSPRYSHYKVAPRMWVTVESQNESQPSMAEVREWERAQPLFRYDLIGIEESLSLRCECREPIEGY